MNEFVSIYLSELHGGMNCAIHKKLAGVYDAKRDAIEMRKVAAGGKGLGALGMLAALLVLGRNSWDKIQPKMNPYIIGGTLGGGAIGAGLNMMKDSNVPQIDPNAFAQMTPEQREDAKGQFRKQRTTEMIRRGILGGLKGGVGGGTLGALGAVSQGAAETVMEQGPDALDIGGALKKYLGDLGYEKVR